jgi:hypothetical protein
MKIRSFWSGLASLLCIFFHLFLTSCHRSEKIRRESAILVTFVQHDFEKAGFAYLK